MLVRRAYVPDGDGSLDRTQWPYTVPCVADLVDDGLDFTHPVTFFVGENGSGKSTLVEAIAEAYGLAPRADGPAASTPTTAPRHRSASG